MSATLTTTLDTGYAGMTVRTVTGLALSVTITAGLFWIMPYLIDVAEIELDTRPPLGQVDIFRKKIVEDPPPRRKIPQRLDTKPNPPPQQPRPTFGGETIEVTPVNLPAPTTELPTEQNPYGIGLGEGDYLPIVKVAPVYPQRAASRGIEGICVVEYTVTRNGTIRDPRIVEGQCASSLFHRSSLDAARKFKYKPRVIDGVAIEVPGVRNQFTYELTE